MNIVILASVVVLLNLLILVILENSSESRYITEPADSPLVLLYILILMNPGILANLIKIVNLVNCGQYCALGESIYSGDSGE